MNEFLKFKLLNESLEVSYKDLKILNEYYQGETFMDELVGNTLKGLGKVFSGIYNSIKTSFFIAKAKTKINKIKGKQKDVLNSFKKILDERIKFLNENKDFLDILKELIKKQFKISNEDLKNLNKILKTIKKFRVSDDVSNISEYLKEKELYETLIQDYEKTILKNTTEDSDFGKNYAQSVLLNVKSELTQSQIDILKKYTNELKKIKILEDVLKIQTDLEDVLENAEELDLNPNLETVVLEFFKVFFGFYLKLTDVSVKTFESSEKDEFENFDFEDFKNHLKKVEFDPKELDENIKKLEEKEKKIEELNKKLESEKLDLKSFQKMVNNKSKNIKEEFKKLSPEDQNKVIESFKKAYAKSYKTLVLSRISLENLNKKLKELSQKKKELDPKQKDKIAKVGTELKDKIKNSEEALDFFEDTQILKPDIIQTIKKTIEKEIMEKKNKKSKK